MDRPLEAYCIEGTRTKPIGDRRIPLRRTKSFLHYIGEAQQSNPVLTRSVEQCVAMDNGALVSNTTGDTTLDLTSKSAEN